MCGRFAQTTPPDDLVRLFRLVMGIEFGVRYNLAPTQDVVVIRTLNDGRHAQLFRWGLVPSWAESLQYGARMINARAETIFQKGSFSGPILRQRCVIPSTGFYEWTTTPEGKIPTLIRPAEAEVFSMAGIWSTWADDAGTLTWTCSILTTGANAILTPIHNRMPVLLDANGIDTWLDPKVHERDTIEPLLVAAPDASVTLCTVGTRVNSVKNDGPECWSPPAS